MDELLGQVLARPDDDGVRLLFADWCARRDAARAEFIRLQIEEAAGLGASSEMLLNETEATTEERKRHWRAEARRAVANARDRGIEAVRLLRKGWRLWVPAGEVLAGEMAEVLVRTNGSGGATIEFAHGGRRGRLVFRRGFLAEVACAAWAWESHFWEVATEAPVKHFAATDKRPWLGGWLMRSWGDASEPEVGASLPPGVFSLLEGWRQEFVTDRSVEKRYGGILEATEALSRAAIRYARTRAGEAPIESSRS